jgi:hypothetical protein
MIYIYLQYEKWIYKQKDKTLFMLNSLNDRK